MININILNIENFFKNNKWLIIYITTFLILIVIVKQCEKEPEVVTKTVTKTITVTDTITETIIKEVPKEVYIEKIKTIKGKDTIIYKDKPTDNSITTKQFKTELNSNNAKASLLITANELFDVQGVITYPYTEKTTTITKIKSKSGLFIYGDVPINRNAIILETGVIYQIKNKFMLKGGIEYNDVTRSANIKVGLGIRIL
jgi:hypothetical protein